MGMVAAASVLYAGWVRYLPPGPAPFKSPWWVLIPGWLVLVTPFGRMALTALGSRLLLRGVRPGRYPRGGSVHVRLWASEQLAEVATYSNQVNPHHSAATPEYVAAVQAHGMRINPYTVNDPALMRALIANGVDGIISDRPDVLREEIRNARPAA